MEIVMEALLRCLVNRGMFSGEVAVRGKTSDGTEFSLFVPEDFVEANLSATADQSVDGWLRVEVLAREGALILVRLPSQTFENGQTVTVRDDQVENRARREPV
jgi:hypothetical protein